MRWTAILPLKPGAERKRRLRSLLSPGERHRLTETLLDHATAALRGSVAVGAINLVAEKAPEGWAEGWIQDRGRGLNGEIEAARKALGAVPLIVIHPDLPLLGSADVEALAEAAAASGVAIAPDRHRTGTNAVAVAAGVEFEFHFGPGSFLAHRGQSARATIVDTPGLSIDLDTPEDWACAVRGGFVLATD